MQKSILVFLMVLFVGTLAEANTQAKIFNSEQEYVEFVKNNPKIKVVAVTPITKSTQATFNDSFSGIYSVYTAGYLVTYTDSL